MSHADIRDGKGGPCGTVTMFALFFLLACLFSVLLSAKVEESQKAPVYKATLTTQDPKACETFVVLGLHGQHDVFFNGEKVLPKDLVEGPLELCARQLSKTAKITVSFATH